MKVTKLTLENFKGFKGEVDINFPKSNLTVVVGVNGSGKSSILSTLVYFFNNVIKSFQGNAKSEQNFSTLDINVNASYAKVKMNFTYESNLLRKEHYSYENKNPYLSTEFNINFQNELSLNKNIINFIGEEVNLKLSNDSNANLPIICLFSPSRSISSNEETNLIRYTYPQIEAYFGALSSKYFFSYFTEWFLEQTNIENQLKVEKKDFNVLNAQLETVRKAMNTFLKSFPFANFSNIRVGTSDLSKKLNKKQTIIIDKNGETLAISQLSDGEKSILQMVMDIAYRLSIANPSRNPLKEGTGIVLIDELDLHLHPSWQKAIINCLQTTFPKIQFIVTTHSPLIISQVQKEDILVLHDNKCTTLPKYIHNGYNSYGSDLEDVLKIIMGTGELLPSSLAEKFKQYFSLIDNNKLTEAKLLQKEMIALTDSHHPHILKGQTLMDLKELGVA